MSSKRRGHTHGVLRKCIALIAGGTVGVASISAWAQAVEGRLGEIVISATRSEKPSFDVPASIDTIDASSLEAARLQVNLSESLVRVPGIIAQNRQNYAQDLQISSRGFGARSTFGMRGLRLYVDGIPATMPDGQGQLSHIDLSSAARIEVLRGPYSALYGNSSGGVISVFTQDGGPDTVADISTVFGSDGTRRVGMKASGQQGKISYVLSANRFETNGWRDHSAAERTNLNGRFKYSVDEDTHWTFVINSMRMPETQDPLGLTRAAFEANPRQAPAVAYQFNTRKSSTQQQGGMTLDRKLSADDSLQLSTYVGTRDTTQFQAIPTASQTPASSPGGVIDLSRNFWGTDARWTHRGRLLDTPATITAGMAYDRMREGRRGFQNFTGPASAPTQIGVLGALRRDENNTVTSFDQYLQGEWEVSKRWTASAGVRHSRVSFQSADHYLSNGNDSGAVAYNATTPVAGLVFHANDNLNLYTTLGRGFETPTFNELAYRPNGATGLNFGLNPARSHQWELGAKMRIPGNWLANVAYFEARTYDEIVVLTNSGGRTTYQNAGRTLRKGVEASVSGPLGGGFSVYGAATVLNATYLDGFGTCVASPCTTPNVTVASGNRIPGVPRSSLYAELQWRQPQWGFETALELRHVAKVFVNDLNTDAAPAYAIANLRLSWRQSLGQWALREFVRVDNLSGKHYAGSVIVNEGNQRYFESAPGRNWLVGVSAAYQF